MSSRAGGLYGGIQFSSGKAFSSSTTPQETPQSSLPSSVVETSQNPPAAISKDQPSSAPSTQNATASSSTASDAGASVKATAGWSASLAFAPIRRNQAQKAKPPTARLPVGAAVTTAPASIASGAVISSTAVVFAPPSLVEPTKPAETQPTQPQGQGWGKKVKPPSMILDEDINGFKAQRGERRGGGKKKGKKNKNLPVIPVWDPSESYDPMRPNDYGEYKIHKRKEREERRERLLAEKRRAEERKRYRRSSSYSDSYGSDSEDERPRKTGKVPCTIISYKSSLLSHQGATMTLTIRVISQRTTTVRADWELWPPPYLLPRPWMSISQAMKRINVVLLCLLACDLQHLQYRPSAQVRPAYQCLSDRRVRASLHRPPLHHRPC
ncbi:hypothetical protein AcW1_010313 [Taiwanofungus camphoratus]|nr:hypothetical protein AcW1_010313 [Antrodia cinnamomea]